MVYLLICLSVLFLQYLLIKLSIKLLKSQSVKAHLAVGSLIGLILGTPLLVAAPYCSAQLEGLLLELMGPQAGQAVSGPAIGYVLNDPLSKIASISGLENEFLVLALLLSIGMLFGLYLALMHFLRLKCGQGWLHSMCSISILCMPLLIAANFVFLGQPGDSTPLAVFRVSG